MNKKDEKRLDRYVDKLVDTANKFQKLELKFNDLKEKIDDLIRKALSR